MSHSLSPVLHRAAYQALGLGDWRYDRIECDAAALPGTVGELGPEWVGLSVTMPGKRAALAFADEVTERAAAVGAANTLTRRDTGPGDASDGRSVGRWRADCTDIDGVAGALRAAAGFSGGGHGVVLGAGGTAVAALAAFAELGLGGATVVVRDPARAEAARVAARRLGLAISVVRFDEGHLARLAAGADALVSTVPAAAAEPYVAELAAARSVLDVIYDPWPTPLAEAVLAHGRPVATGLDMLLHQAFGQVEQFTGMAAPRRTMRDALWEATREATSGELPLPLTRRGNGS